MITIYLFLYRQSFVGDRKRLHAAVRDDDHHRYLHRHLGIDARRRRRSCRSLAKVKDEGDGLVRDVV